MLWRYKGFIVCVCVWERGVYEHTHTECVSAPWSWFMWCADTWTERTELCKHWGSMFVFMNSEDTHSNVSDWLFWMRTCLVCPHRNTAHHRWYYSVIKHLCVCLSVCCWACVSDWWCSVREGVWVLKELFTRKWKWVNIDRIVSGSHWLSYISIYFLMLLKSMGTGNCLGTNICHTLPVKF